MLRFPLQSSRSRRRAAALRPCNRQEIVRYANLDASCQGNTLPPAQKPRRRVGDQYDSLPCAAGLLFELFFCIGLSDLPRAQKYRNLLVVAGWSLQAVFVGGSALAVISAA